jgi:predicted phage terminase large subunit-like protein
MPSVRKSRDKQHVSETNFLGERIKDQLPFWPDYVEKWDQEADGKRFRSEVLSLTELWNLYLGYTQDSELDDKGSIKAKTIAPVNPKKGYGIIPIRTIALPGRFCERAVAHKEHQHGYLHFHQWLYARDQARKDLYWFGKEVFQMDFVEHVHRVTCNQFVQKDFDGVFEEGYDRNDLKVAFNRQSRIPKIWVPTGEYDNESSIKYDENFKIEDLGHYIPDPNHAELKVNLARTMILLDPRGFFKTFTNILDTVQWIINCPDVRILIMSGTYKLTLQFLSLAKGKFYLPPGRKPEYFHLLFPEYVDRSADGDSKEPLVVLNRKHDSPDPTLGIMSIGSSLSGFHCDVLKFDDIVTDENCNTEETRQSLLDKADGAVNLLMPWGWHDIIGTRYFPNDYYGQAEAKYKESPEDFNLKLFTRAAWVVKPEFEEIEKNSLFDLKEHMVVLTFPEHKTWALLRKDLSKNEKSFRCQQLNQPVWGNEKSINFERIVLESHRFRNGVQITLQEVLLAKPDYVYGAIDLARENKDQSDYTALAVGKVYQFGLFQNFLTPDELASAIKLDGEDEGKWVLVILDVQFGKWSQTEIANRIAAMHNKWQCKSWYGEDTGGLALLKEKIADVSKTTYGCWPYIRWDVPSNSEGAKRNRIKGLETLLKANRLYFLTDTWNEKVFEELEKYKGQKSTRYFKDDVPDVLSQLTKFIPSLVTLSKKDMEQQALQKQAEYNEYIRREIKRVVFGDNSGGFGMNSSQYLSYGMELPDQQSDNTPMSDIGKKIFGGNGIRI